MYPDAQVPGYPALQVPVSMRRGCPSPVSHARSPVSGYGELAPQCSLLVNDEPSLQPCKHIWPIQEQQQTSPSQQQIHILCAMAQTTYDPLAPPQTSNPTDPLIDLDRLLGRLRQTILRADAERERRLRTSEFEREKVTVVR